MERSFLWKSTTPFPSSPWENPRLPWKAFGPQRESSRKRRVRPCIPMGNLCSHPLPPVPTLNLTGDFLFFCSPFTILVALGAPSGAEAADGLCKKRFLAGNSRSWLWEAGTARRDSLHLPCEPRSCLRAAGSASHARGADAPHRLLRFWQPGDRAAVSRALGMDPCWSREWLHPKSCS